MTEKIPTIIQEISLDTIQRIDLGLEGDWSPTVVTTWTRENGFIGFEEAVHSHPKHQPSLELYFENTWLGIHCFNRINGQNIFDQAFAFNIIQYIEQMLCKPLTPERT